MRLLFDQNISFRVVKQLKDALPDVKSVWECGLFNADDYQIWEYARQNEYTVVTFDRDIPAIGSVRGFPPKIIWLRTGNLRNQAIILLFKERADEFVHFINNKQEGCLMIYPDLTSDNETTTI